MTPRVRIAAVAALALVTLGYGLGRGWLGRHEGPGQIEGAGLPPAEVGARAVAQRSASEAAGESGERSILFGDLHVHTTLSLDAFLMSLPLIGGEGSHPQADACDFARYCSALDFWSINDHAEYLTQRRWRETVESIRECNARSGDPRSPDSVAFLGWEWTNIGVTPEEHWGHKNVVLRETDAEKIPARPIGAILGSPPATLMVNRLSSVSLPDPPVIVLVAVLPVPVNEPERCRSGSRRLFPACSS